MPNLFRSAAPALLVGTAAVIVVGAADDGLVAATASDGVLQPAPASGGSAVELSPLDRLGQLLDDYDDDEHDDDDEYNDYGNSSGSQMSVQPDPSVPNASGGNPAVTSCSALEVVGPVVRTEWGPVQVAAQVENGRVCGVRTLSFPDGDRKSVMINARAVPALDQQAVASGDASFQGVSGATVTSDGYRKSLQAVLDGA